MRSCEWVIGSRLPSSSERGTAEHKIVRLVATPTGDHLESVDRCLGGADQHLSGQSAGGGVGGGAAELACHFADDVAGAAERVADGATGHAAGEPRPDRAARLELAHLHDLVVEAVVVERSLDGIDHLLFGHGE